MGIYILFQESMNLPFFRLRYTVIREIYGMKGGELVQRMFLESVSQYGYRGWSAKPGKLLS